MEPKCAWCKDTGLVDKVGGLADRHRYPLGACPLCKKDGVKELAVKEAEEALKNLDHKRKLVCWTIVLDNKYTQDMPKAIENEIFKKMGPGPKNAKPAQFIGTTTTGEYRVALHPSLYYDTVKKLIFWLNLPKDTYRIEEDEESVKAFTK